MSSLLSIEVCPDLQLNMPGRSQFLGHRPLTNRRSLFFYSRPLVNIKFKHIKPRYLPITKPPPFKTKQILNPILKYSKITNTGNSSTFLKYTRVCISATANYIHYSRVLVTEENGRPST